MQQKLSKPTREDVAYHEAGHAVIAYLTGYHIIDGPIHIDGEETEDGHAHTPIAEDDGRIEERRLKGWVIDEFERRKQRSVIAVAGYTAELVHAAIEGLDFNERRAFMGAHGDVETVRQTWGPQSFYPFSKALGSEMAQPEVWDMVEALAKALLENDGPLPSESAMSVLESSRRSSEAPFRLFLPYLRPPN